MLPPPPDRPPSRFGAPVEVEVAWLRRVDRFLRRVLFLESGANVLPLLHVAFYYVFLGAVLVPGLVTSMLALVPLWVLICLLNYSLSIGILHMHAHRKLFTLEPLNRVLEFLLCIPCVLSYPMMKYMHVYLHHRYENGPRDPTTTRDAERGWRALWYWIRYAYVCQKHTVIGLFGGHAHRAWKRLRRQYLIDTIGTLSLMVAYLVLVDPLRMLVFWEVPLIVVSVNIGFFAWITHAPASSTALTGSFNTTNNLMNFFIHNQGYHLVHHRYPGIHWTMIPERLDVLLETEDRLIAPYWVVLVAAWRVIVPRHLYDPAAGGAWKQRFRRRSSEHRTRLAWLPYFGWI